MKYLLILSFCCFLFSTQAQLKPDFFPEDVVAETLNPRCYCKPGVKNKSRSKGIVLSYGLLNNGSFEADDEPLTGPASQYNAWHNLNIKVKVPLINKEKLKVLLGYSYYSDIINFSFLGPDYTETLTNLNDQALKSNSFGIYMTRSLNEKNYIGGRFRISSNGNYGGWMHFEGRTNIYKFLGVYGIKPNDNLEWGFGINITHGFRGTFAIPLFIYNRTFNEQWGIEMALPGFVNMRYNVNEANILLAGVEYGSKSYRLDVNNNTAESFDYAYNHSEITFSVRLEHRFAPWIWGNARIGYQTNFTNEFESRSENTQTFELDPSSGAFFKVGLFLSPPDKFLER